MRRRMVHHLTAVAAGSLFHLITTTPALANETWCDIDPPVVITTPQGNQVVVYVVNGGPVEHVAELTYPTITYTARNIKRDTQTAVHLNVTIDDSDGHRHTVNSEVWSGPGKTGTLLSQHRGKAGHTLRHRFTLDTP